MMRNGGCKNAKQKDEIEVQLLENRLYTLYSRLNATFTFEKVDIKSQYMNCQGPCVIAVDLELSSYLSSSLSWYSRQATFFQHITNQS